MYAGLANLLAYLPVLGKSSPDLILLLGSRTGMFLGGKSGSMLPKSGCKCIQVDTDGSEIGRSLPIDLGIVSDVQAFLYSLLNSISTPLPKASEEWTALATSLQSLPSSHDREPEETTPGHPHPYHSLKALFTTLGSIAPGAIVCIDGGEANSWAAGLTHLCKPHLVMFAGGYMGFLGTGFGHALGCAIADASRLVVNIQGDGSAGFHFVELDTYARFKCRILTVVVNNGCWGMSANGQDALYGEAIKGRPASSLSPVTSYEVVARGLGNRSVRVDKVGEVEEAVKTVLGGEGPACVELVVSNKPTHPGTIAMVGKTDDPNVVVVPYYENVPRAFYK
jgi:thiamine pyrophosphate-dependent acetolactate synthase large subunit-like protein